MNKAAIFKRVLLQRKQDKKKKRAFHVQEKAEKERFGIEQKKPEHDLVILDKYRNKTLTTHAPKRR